MERREFPAGPAQDPDRPPPRPGDVAYVGFTYRHRGPRWIRGVVRRVYCDIPTHSARYVIQLDNDAREIPWPVERLRW